MGGALARLVRAAASEWLRAGARGRRWGRQRRVICWRRRVPACCGRKAWWRVEGGDGGRGQRGDASGHSVRGTALAPGWAMLAFPAHSARRPALLKCRCSSGSTLRCIASRCAGAGAHPTRRLFLRLFPPQRVRWPAAPALRFTMGGDLHINWGRARLSALSPGFGLASLRCARPGKPFSKHRHRRRRLVESLACSRWAPPKPAVVALAVSGARRRRKWVALCLLLSALTRRALCCGLHFPRHRHRSPRAASGPRPDAASAPGCVSRGRKRRGHIDTDCMAAATA